VPVRCAVLGDPVGHSLSPALHRAGYAAVGLGWEYRLHRVPAGGLAAFVGGLGPEWRGLSLTMPLKREALDLADRVAPSATLAGAANTLVLVDGEVHADNTDVPGAAAAVRERYDGPLTEATVLGGGATAASVSLALAGLGVSRIRLLVRSPGRAAETVAAIGRHPGGVEVSVGSLADDPVVGDLVASTIPAAAQSADLVARCGAAPVVFEIVYDPWPTPLAASVTTSGGDRVLVGGLDLLVHQAALQFVAFTGVSAPLDAMRAAGERSLAARAG
jgi:shikimate dehydrogenase